jgi:copper chaperone
MKTAQLNVTGMTCGGCAASVRNALVRLPGVSAVDVSLADGRVEVRFDDSRVDAEQMREAVQGAGYEVTAAPQPRRSGGGCCS